MKLLYVGCLATSSEAKRAIRFAAFGGYDLQNVTAIADAITDGTDTTNNYTWSKWDNWKSYEMYGVAELAYYPDHIKPWLP
jgi:hypothetical protein